MSAKLINFKDRKVNVSGKTSNLYASSHMAKSQATNLKPHAVNNFTDDKERQNPQSPKNP